jgi:hypothetical protein
MLRANGTAGTSRISASAPGTDPVAIDSYGATLFNITGKDVPHVLYASQMGLGEIDLKNVKVMRVDLA